MAKQQNTFVIWVKSYLFMETIILRGTLFNFIVVQLYNCLSVPFYFLFFYKLFLKQATPGKKTHA